MPEISETFFARNAAAWRRWLKKNHATKTEVWIILLKKHVDEPSVSYDEAVEEALCWGWIDGLLKRIDDRSHTIRFTPRKPTSRWSQLNVARVKKLVREERMQPPGLEAVRVAKEKGEWQRAYGRTARVRMPGDLKAALARNKRAITNFEAFPPGARRTYIAWVLDAKREATREKRIREVVKAAAANKRPGIA